MNFLEKIIAVWRNVSLVQRALLLAISMTFMIVAGMLVYWARRPEMQTLYQGLAPEEAAKVTDQISQQGVNYELRNGGTTILAPKEKIYQLRLDMAKEGLPSGDQGGYKIFDNDKIGISPFVQNVNLQRALQEELAKSIQMIDGVVHARVHIVSPDKTLFTSEQDNTTASIVLRLKPGYRLSPVNIAAITHLVAGSVPNLKSEKVTVIDSKGQLLSYTGDQTTDNGASTVADYKERVEHNLADKVEQMLTTALGPGRASVKVSAEIDMTSVSIVTETYEPKGTTTKEEIKEKTKTEPATADSQGQAPVPGGTEKDNTIVTEMVVGKTVQQKVELPGEIKSLSVAALVDLSPADPNQTEKIMQLSEVQEIIQSALGLDLNGRDTLKVAEAKFHRPVELPAAAEPQDWSRYMAIARHSSLGIMAICALFVFRIFGSAKRKTPVGAGAAELPGGGRAGLLPAEAVSSDPMILREQIAKALRNNPDQAKQLFSSWLEEES
ncbi:MAG TPA: flagellar basal-body MS-ring/collar protein FliF [Sedimentisphaerales bacterium]|nr:flagellar basal-body MS-ring/collar protein FliF [Sedimentisphaerales bacterium]